MNEKNNLVSTAYDKKNSQTYDEKRFTKPQGKMFHLMELKQLLKGIDHLEKRKACLEVGCGTGRFLIELAKRGYNVEGVEPSNFMLEIAKDKCSNFPTVKFKQAEGASLPYKSESFDFVYCIRTLNQTESKEYAKQMIKELIRVTNSGGTILIEFCNEWRPFKRSRAVRFSVREIKHLVATIPEAKILKIKGILILSGWLLDHTPFWLLPLFFYTDSVFSYLFPSVSSRCYVTLSRN